MTSTGRRIAVAVLAGALVGWPVVGRAAMSDAWITTKTKIDLLTAKNVHSSGINVDTVDGVVTLHGKVDSAEDKANAEAEAKKIDGVREVRNMLQVVPERRKEAAKASDSQLKDRVSKALKNNADLKNSSISVQSWASVPPVPDWSVTTASPASYSPSKSAASSRRASSRRSGTIVRSISSARSGSSS